MGKCRSCGRPCEGKWGFCHRPGPCNQARIRAIRERQRAIQDTRVYVLQQENAALRARLTELEVSR
jgi:hypothetical protein